MSDNKRTMDLFKQFLDEVIKNDSLKNNASDKSIQILPKISSKESGHLKVIVSFDHISTHGMFSF